MAAALAIGACSSDNESTLLWEGSAPLAVVDGADAGERTWAVDVAFEPPLVIDRRSYGVLVRLPSPLGTDDEVVGATVELVPETPERRAPALVVSGKDTFLRRSLRQGAILSRLSVRVKAKTSAPPAADGPALVSVGGIECLTGLADEWQAGRFGTEPVRMAYVADCARR